MGKSNSPLDPMEAAKARWANSPGAHWQTFEEARASCEATANSLLDIIRGISTDPFLGLERRELDRHRPTSTSTRFTIDYEASLGTFVRRFLQRLYSQDVDMYGMVVAADLLEAIVNSLGDRLEVPAVAGAKVRKASKAGASKKKQAEADMRKDEATELRRQMAEIQSRNPKITSRKRIAELIVKVYGGNVGTIRKKLADL